MTKLHLTVMKKYIWVSMLLVGCFLKSISQSSPAFRLDSLKLDSLKRLLAFAKDRERVDLLNDISDRMGFVIPQSQRLDSEVLYAQKAYAEAIKIGYKDGSAMALLNQSGATVLNVSDSIKASKEKNIRRAIQLGEETNNNKVLGFGYYFLSGVPSIARDFKKQADCYIKSADYFLMGGDTLRAAEVTNWLTDLYRDNLNDYEQAFDYCKKSIFLSQKVSERDVSRDWQQFLVQYSVGNLSQLYSMTGDYATAMNYLKLNKQYAIAHQTGWLRNADIADLFCQMGDYDSALVYWNLWRNDPGWSATAPGHKAWGNSIRGKIFAGQKQYDQAILIFKKNVEGYENGKIRNEYGIAREFGYIANAYYEMGNYKEAFPYAKTSLDLINAGKYNDLVMKGCQSMSSIYHQLGKNDSAYKYLLRYHTLKDSTLNRQFLLRLYNYKKEAEDVIKESRIGLLNRDNQIKQQQLKQEATFRNFLLAAFLAVVFAGLYAYRSIHLKRRNERLLQERKEQQWKLKELESENKHAYLQQQSAELEMKALRAQMNPHFIFNSLGSINHFILKNEGKTASGYLTRFSRLIRMVLINSQKPLITLNDELEMLRIYLDMERLRFKNSFNYVISFINEIDAENVSVPPLILQPFCENALWHGLMHKEGQGHLAIDLSMEEKILQCVITDDGIGRQKAAALKNRLEEKEKSMGLQITTQRLALINQNKNIQTFYTIDDILDEHKNVTGTKVTLKISHDQMKRELV